MEEKMKVSKITMDDEKEYLVIDKIEDNEVVYLFLIDAEENKNIAIRKCYKNNKNAEVFKLKNLEELAHVYELYQKKHENSL